MNERLVELAEGLPARTVNGAADKCCGKKPIPYMRTQHWFCDRCCASFRMPDGEQIENWAWRRDKDRFRPTYDPFNPSNDAGDYARPFFRARSHAD